jgi:Ion transport protein
LRILRPLKVIKKVPGMPKLVATIIDSLPVMVDVMLLFIFALVVFGTIAT